MLTPGLTDINPVIRPIESRISTNRTFKRIGLLKSANTLINSDDGYVMYDLNIYKANFTPSSSLYLIELKLSVTPGYVASKNGTKQQNGNNYKEYSFKEGMYIYQ